MHPKFADWYRAVQIIPDNEMLAGRWKGVEELNSKVKPLQTLELIRVFYQRPTADAQFADWFRQFFKTADASFPMQGNDLELAILAGASVVDVLDKGKRQHALIAALGMMCADYRTRRVAERPADFLLRVRQYLVERSVALRNDLRAKSGPFAEVKQVPEIGTPADLPAVTQALALIATAIRDLQKAAVEATDFLERRQRLLGEESNILWWVLSGYSRDLDRPFSGIHPAMACLVVGKELADLIDVLPGPASCPAILARVLRRVDGTAPTHVTILEGVRNADSSWLSQWAKDHRIASCGDLCPILLSAQRALETPGSDAWAEGVEAVTGVSVSAQLDPLQLATQAHDEHRLLRALAGLP